MITAEQQRLLQLTTHLILAQSFIAEHASLHGTTEQTDGAMQELGKALELLNPSDD